MTTYPTPVIYNETQNKILAAAIRCVKKFGIEKTNLNDIAKEAGVTRPTVYSYFPNRNDVIRSALLQSGYVFADRLLQNMKKYSTPQERLIESIMFAFEELPKEPYLVVITQTDVSSYLNQDALSDAEGQAICLSLFAEIYKDTPIAAGDLIEVIELTTRLLLSLLIIRGPLERTLPEYRAFLQRRLLPAVGL